MAQKKAHEVEAWLARPDPKTAIVLIYGPDRGLVSERAKAFAEKSGVPLDDPFSVVKLDAGSETEPGRVVDEARTVSMFSPRRLLWIRNAGNQKSLVDDLAELAKRPPSDAILLVEGGDLKKGASLRALAEESSVAIALPCYADESKTIDTLINDELKRSNLTITEDARAALHELLGGDRMASRGEIEKLGLHAGEGGEITLSDVRLLTGDVSAASMDEVIEQAVQGNPSELGRLFSAHVTLPAQVQPLLAAALRQFQTLYFLRATMDSTRANASSAVSAVRPPPFGPRRAALERGVTRWPMAALQTALAQLQSAVLESRRRQDLALAVAERTLLSLAVRAKRN